MSVLWFGTLHQRKLINPDEGRYAEIPREMVASGDWLTPRLNDIKYFEKPALQYWATAAAYTVFGQHEWTARLWSALCGFLGILATAFTVRRLWGKDAALYAASVLSSSLLWVMIGHVNTLDMGVSFFLSAAIFCFVLAQRDEAAATPNATRHWMWLGWFMLALAILNKGLIGMALPAATLVVYTLWQRDFSIWRKLHLVSGLALLLAVTAPWFIAVSRANPEFAHFFFIHEHFERFLTKAHGRYQPMWYFIPILLAGMLPWLVSLFTMLTHAIRRNPEQHFQPQRFLLVWCVVVFGFFSASSSKLASYILPLFPALAALIGLHLARLSARRPHLLVWHAAPFVVLGIVALYFAPEATRFSSERVPAELYANYIPWLRAAAISLLVGALLAILFARAQKPRSAILSLATGGLLMSLAILLGHDSLSPANSAAHIAAKIREQVKPDAPFFSVNTYDQSLQFYLKRPTTMVFYKDELGFGIEHEPHKFIADQKGFEQAWTTAPEAWALLDPATWQRFEKEGIPMRVIARDTRRVIVKKP
ncbi:MAG: glycosyltransferase family 39 protein [Sterolibacterium sp.]|nr:glycosyltransferase family 39 protein [Sterolibacterium sp.]